MKIKFKNESIFCLIILNTIFQRLPDQVVILKAFSSEDHNSNSINEKIKKASFAWRTIPQICHSLMLLVEVVTFVTLSYLSRLSEQHEFFAIPGTVSPRSILQPHKLKYNFGAGNKYHLAHVKKFLTYTACVKVVFRVLDHFKSKKLYC
ncbi:hypothetical protein BpHYR1_013686 [Brachionus plicatilis]|uniref:Uncharacterized protein n=1 Tax=Brachionus plicatilis TaxID=10195 RepID=A0A3M7RTV4_BRAPC|nr:hypothetical protein BpHYR1_013686 [Brachionus plicatilis]